MLLEERMVSVNLALLYSHASVSELFYDSSQLSYYNSVSVTNLLVNASLTAVLFFSFSVPLGADETEEEGEESESSEKNESDINSTDNVVKNGEEEYPDIVMIPSDVTRFSVSAI